MFDDSHNQEEIIHNIITKVMDSIDGDEPYTAINQADFLMKMLTPEEKKEFDTEQLQKELKSFLLKINNNRHLRMNQRIKQETETAIEYYGEDIGNDKRLFYNKDLEEDLILLQDLIKEKMTIIAKKKLTDPMAYE